jgi:aryl-alcohol dehydrogenase-like predicted oxidoreductase
MILETREIAPDYIITRLIRGGWQLAGGHGIIDREQAVEDLLATFDAGVTTFDCADIYTGVEELYGAFRERLRASRGDEAARRLRVHTKLVPDLAILAMIKRADVESLVDRSLRRLRVDHVADILAVGIPLASMQVQYSVLDHRAESGFAELCR